MKVINIITGRDNGGGGEYVLNICSSSCYSSDLICIGEGELVEKARSRNIPVIIFNLIDFFNDNFLNYVNKNKIEVILWHGAKAFFLHRFMDKNIKNRSLAVVHSDFKKDFVNKRFLERNILTTFSYIGLKSFDKFIAVSQLIQDIIKKNFSYKELHIVRNSIDINIKHQANGITRESIGLNDSDFVFVNIARLHPIKNHINLIKGFKILNLKYPFSKLVIVGDGSERKKIEEFIKNNNLNNSILLLGEKHNAYRYFKLANANILTSISEGGEPPIVLLEGGVFETATIFPGVGYLDKIINEDMGYKLNPYNIEDIYLAMEKCLIDDKRVQKAEEFNKFAVERYSISKFHKKFNEIFQGKVEEEAK